MVNKKVTTTKIEKKNPFSFSAENISPRTVNIALRAEDNNKRSIIGAQTRSDVTKSGKKMFRQKGTGRARQGDGSAPHLRGGGVAFGPNLRNHAKKITKGQRKAAFKFVFCDDFSQGKIIVIKKLPEFKEISTKKIKNWLTELTGEGTRSLIINDTFLENFKKSIRNLWYANFLPVGGLNIRSLLRAEKILVTEKALGLINERFGGQK
jgi:large subunit ribosomal protein L4